MVGRASWRTAQNRAEAASASAGVNLRQAGAHLVGQAARARRLPAVHRGAAGARRLVHIPEHSH